MLKKQIQFCQTRILEHRRNLDEPREKTVRSTRQKELDVCVWLRIFSHVSFLFDNCNATFTYGSGVFSVSKPVSFFFFRFCFVIAGSEDAS